MTPQHLLAIDPGISTGWALLSNGKLYACGCGDPRETLPIAPLIDLPYPLVVIEFPQIYPRSKSKGDPNDIMKLALRVGEYKNHFESQRTQVRLFLPHEWKGQQPKTVCHKQMFSGLTDWEKDILDSSKTFKKQTEDMLDAVALGKWYYKTGHLMTRPYWAETYRQKVK